MRSTQSKIAAYTDVEQWPQVVAAIHRDQTYNTMLGLFPHTVIPQRLSAVLDIGCGPGGWLLSALKTYPHLKGTGIDISQLMIEHANLLAQAEGVSNAEFTVMNAATQPMDFPDASFDFIHVRTMSGFLYREQWPVLVQECFRLLRPKGYLCINEIEVVVPGSDAADAINLLFGKLLYSAGFSFSPSGRNLGLTARLRPLLRQYHFASIEHQAHGIDVSRHSQGWQGAFEEFITMQQTVFPMLVAFQMITQEELDRLYQQALADMQEEFYGCMIYLLSVWGQKPSVNDMTKPSLTENGGRKDSLAETSSL